MESKTLLLVAPGPKYDPVKFYSNRLKTLDKKYQGLVLTSSPSPIRHAVGNFVVIAKPFYPGKLREFLSFLYVCNKLCKEIKNEGKQVDLIVSYDPLKSGLLGLLLKYRLGVKLAVEINGIYDDPANYQDTANYLVAKAKYYCYRRVATFIARRADGIKLLFDGQADSYLASSQKCPIVKRFANLVDVAPFISCPADLAKKRVLFVGYPHFLKGVDVLIQAFSELVDDFPDWKLTILGWYPDASLINRALDGTHNIAYHPPIPAKDMPAQMAAHSILVLPSRAEAMGRVLVEAMGAGVARIGTRWGGIPTVIEDGVDGLLFEKGNVSELVVCLRRLMSSEELRVTLGSAAKKRVIRDFNKEKYFENVDDFYSSIIAE